MARKPKSEKAAPKTIHIVDAALVAELMDAAKARGLGLFSITQAAQFAIAEWAKAQKTLGTSTLVVSTSA